jgi:hypothetical protein
MVKLVPVDEYLLADIITKVRSGAAEQVSFLMFYPVAQQICRFYNFAVKTLFVHAVLSYSDSAHTY